MVDIEKIKDEIIERLMPLRPNKIILFGSYAYGNVTEDSDIDFFLLKDGLTRESVKEYELEASRTIRDLVYKHRVGFDILSASSKFVNESQDYFYKVDILQKGRVLYQS